MAKLRPKLAQVQCSGAHDSHNCETLEDGALKAEAVAQLECAEILPGEQRSACRKPGGRPDLVMQPGVRGVQVRPGV